MHENAKSISSIVCVIHILLMRKKVCILKDILVFVLAIGSLCIIFEAELFLLQYSSGLELGYRSEWSKGQERLNCLHIPLERQTPPQYMKRTKKSFKHGITCSLPLILCFKLWFDNFRLNILVSKIFFFKIKKYYFNVFLNKKYFEK